MTVSKEAAIYANEILGAAFAEILTPEFVIAQDKASFIGNLFSKYQGKIAKDAGVAFNDNERMPG